MLLVNGECRELAGRRMSEVCDEVSGVATE